MAELAGAPSRIRRDEAPTLVLICAVYALWLWGTSSLYAAHPLLGWALTTLTITLFSSLQHEVLHGHPFRSRALNEALVFPGLTLFVPYRRFRDTHIAHHRDPALTDPFDDPESNYMAPEAWERTSRPLRRLLRVNNTLVGRVVLGPAIGTWSFVRDDLRLIRAGAPGIARAWALHGAGVALVLAWLLLWGAMPLWAYLLAAYAGYGILKIRTFLEHRAEQAVGHRTVIIEDRGPLAFLFLFNNLHAVHHLYPGVAWHRLPRLYSSAREGFQMGNGGYVYRSYAEVARRHLLRAKDPVPHPFAGRGGERRGVFGEQ